jgi:FkbM family methyltransferase
VKSSATKTLLLRVASVVQRVLLPLKLRNSKKLAGHRIYFDPATDIGMHLVALGGFEQQALALCAAYIKPDGVVIDVGANIGTHTVHFAQLARNGTVICLEPARATFASLLRNVEHLANVIPLNVALSDTNGVQTFFIASDNAYSGLKDTGRKPIVRQESVACFTADAILPALLRDRRIDLVKIDVEGFETQVLQGMQQLLRSQRPVIFCEICSGQRQNLNPAATVQFCVSLGYEAFVLTGSKLLPAGVHSDDFQNYFFIPRPATAY